MTDEAAGKLTAAIIRLADALATTKEGNEKERSPYNPLKEKAREETLSQTPSARVRGAGARVRARKSCPDARRRLAENGLARLVPVLDQIVKNGKNRRELICNLAKIWHVKSEIARRRYYRGSTDLLTFFSPNKIKGETHVDAS